jgi:hypothetical protein
MTLFRCELLWRKRRALFIWASNDHDSVVLDDTGSLHLFARAEDISSFAFAQGLSLSSEPPAVYDFDSISAWCDDPRGPIDCPRVLDAWNMLSDIHASRGGGNDLLTHVDLRLRDAYDKLFWGCNLPAIIPDRARFDPVWSREERDSLARLLRLGLAKLDAAVSWGAP